VRAADHDRFQDDVGAYLLGALDDDERTRFEAHAAVCHVCQDEIDRLRVAADVLPHSVVQHDPPPTLKQRLMDEVRSELRPDATPRRSRARRRLGLSVPRIAIAASAAALLIGIAAGYLASNGDSGGSRTLAATVDARRVGAAHATLIAANDDGPAELRVTGMPQLPRGHVYEVWLKRGNRIEPGALFSVDRNGNGVGAVPGGIGGVDAVMVTRERAGGAQQPTEVPVVVATT
jgi:anti-sigma-K factor RskA